MDRTRTGYVALILGLALGCTLVTGSAPHTNSFSLQVDEAAGSSRLASDNTRAVPIEPLPDTTDEMARWNMPAEKIYKNVQVFKGMTAREFIGTMEFMVNALGVRCNFCHVQGDFSLDDKPQKKTARTMVHMTNDINTRNFGALTVTCYTCHRGSPVPLAVPSLGQNTWQSLDMSEANSITPADSITIDQVLARYTQALGGEAALKRVTTRVMKISQALPGGPTETIDIYQKAPDKLLVTSTSSDPKRGTHIEGYNGASGWAQFGDRKPSALMHGDLDQVARSAEFFPALDLRSRFTDVKLLGRKKVGDREVYVVSAMARDSGSRDRLYFDTRSGLLVRRYVESSTVLGSIPFAIDYDDYHEMNGVQVPYKLQWTAPRESWTEMVTDLRNNVPVDDAKFSMPAVK